jgi:large subunit ribosomal protein L5
MNRIKNYYDINLCSEIITQGLYKNAFRLPKLEKVVFNLSLKTTKFEDRGFILGRIALYLITNKLAMPSFSSKARQKLKLQKNELSGCRVRLSKSEAWSFLDYYFSVVYPRIKVTKTLRKNNFDKNGNLTFFIRDLIVFPELEDNYKFFSKLENLSITFVFRSNSIEENLYFCRSLRLPLKN